MSEATIQVPAAHVGAVRQGLLARREASDHAADLDALIGQLAGPAEREDAPCTLVGPRSLLWSAVYDALCAAAEQLADDCNDYWRGVSAPATVRAEIASVVERLDLLERLGPPPVA